VNVCFCARLHLCVCVRACAGELFDKDGNVVGTGDGDLEVIEFDQDTDMSKVDVRHSRRIIAVLATVALVVAVAVAVAAVAVAVVHRSRSRRAVTATITTRG
jgi:hypothetical protein